MKGQAIRLPESLPDSSCSSNRHGTNNARVHHRCRCESSRRARAAYEAGRILDLMHGRPRLVSSVGVRRRIQALYAVGWSAESIGREMGQTKRWVQERAGRAHLECWRSSVERVEVAYRRLSTRRGPSNLTAGQARARGYAPPIAWDYCDIDDPKSRPWQGFK